MNDQLNSFWTRIFGTQTPTVSFCEEATNMIIARPWSFISNLPFVLIGIFLFFRGGKEGKYIGLASVIVGLASSLYDASYRFYAQVIDLMGMMLLLNSFLYFPLKSIFKKDSIVFLALFANQILYLILVLFIQGRIGQIWYGLIIATYLALETFQAVKNKHLPKNLVTGLVIFVVATMIWVMDSVLEFCPPQNWLTGRVIFHVLVPISIYFVYKHINQNYSLKVKTAKQ
jgi:hypothetical protein